MSSGTTFESAINNVIAPESYFTDSNMDCVSDRLNIDENTDPFINNDTTHASGSSTTSDINMYHNGMFYVMQPSAYNTSNHNADGMNAIDQCMLIIHFFFNKLTA